MSTILVVEDDAIIAQDIQHTLELLGYGAALTAASGHDAERAMEETPIGLVLMDIKLGGRQDGIETAAKIRSRWDTPVVYVTSHCDERTLLRASETSPYGYVSKPFSAMDLKCAIEQALGRRQIELQAHDAQWLLMALRSIGEAVIATDAEENVTFMNPSAERITGCSSADALGKKFSEVVLVVDERDVAANKPSLRARPIVDTQVASLDGRRLCVDCAVVPIAVPLGPLLGSLIVLRDTTEQRRLEQRLAVTERLASIGSMAAGMAHEINNPLASVISNLEFGLQTVREVCASLRDTHDLVYPHGLSVSVEESLSDALNAAERLRRIVHDLKKFSRADRVGLETLDLPVVLDAALKLTDNQTRHKARVVKCYGTTPLVEANEGKLVQVFTNLLLNAAQAIDEGRVGSNEIVVSTYGDGHRAVVEVRDTGGGIPTHLRDQIFVPFFTTKPVGSGMGLGLSICHNIVTALGGEIGFTTELGGGTTFRVAIPAGVAREARTVSERPIPITSRRARVLVLDDEELIGRAVARLLGMDHDVVVETRGHRVIERVTGGEAFDIIFCDLMMADLSGIDVFTELQRIDPRSAERVVFLTGGAFSPAAAEFVRTTANPTIDKPFTAEQLRSIVSDYAEKSPPIRRH